MGYDVLTCSLFLHHLDDAEPRLILAQGRRRDRSTPLDKRSCSGTCCFRAGLDGLPLVDALAGRRHDGPVSVAAAFSIAEVRMLAQHAGLDSASVVRALASSISFVVESLMGPASRCRAFDGADDSIWDGVVIGAGPAGAMAARELALQGGRILLVERKRFPRWKICGACLNAHRLRACARPAWDR